MIRRFEHSDLGEVLELWHSASVIAHPFLSGDFLDTERSMIASEWLPVSETWVAVRQGSVVGFISMMGQEVGGLFIHPDWQGEGIGTSLLDHVGASTSQLELDVFAANEAAVAFYSGYGFREIRRGRNAETGETEIRMRLD